MTTSETNIAEVLREISASSNKTTGKIIKQLHKAAQQGKSFLKIYVSEYEYNWLKTIRAIDREYEREVREIIDYPTLNGHRKTIKKSYPTPTPPMIERLQELGFTLFNPEICYGWFGIKKYTITIAW